jgi:DUF1009 family protein
VRHSSGKIGIIAGTGELPGHIARSLHSSGRDIFVAGLKGADPYVLDNPDWESVGIDFHHMQDVFDALRQAGVTEVILAGKVDHRDVYHIDSFDERTLRFLESLRDKRGATILAAVVANLEEEGYFIPSLLDVAPDLVPGAGPVVGPQPGPMQVKDLNFGWSLARRIADLDIGQTIVVKGSSVVAVEAMEGTDEAIRRGLNLAGNGITVIKVAARHHDFRFDVPTIGVRTIDVLAEGGGCTLAFESGRCFILDMDEVFSLCEEKGITLLSCSEDGNGELFWPIK